MRKVEGIHKNNREHSLCVLEHILYCAVLCLVIHHMFVIYVSVSIISKADGSNKTTPPEVKTNINVY